MLSHWPFLIEIKVFKSWYHANLISWLFFSRHRFELRYRSGKDPYAGSLPGVACWLTRHSGWPPGPRVSFVCIMIAGKATPPPAWPSRWQVPSLSRLQLQLEWYQCFWIFYFQTSIRLSSLPTRSRPRTWYSSSNTKSISWSKWKLEIFYLNIKLKFSVKFKIRVNIIMMIEVYTPEEIKVQNPSRHHDSSIY